MTLAEILKDSDYRQSQFNIIQVHEFEQKIIVRNDKNGNPVPYIACAVRKKEIRLTPEEAVRQLYLEIILNDYKYPADRVELEYAVTFGREKKRADIVIFDKDRTTAPYIIVELKKPRLK
ncbi:MAG: type I restriction enzyme HsdR N-terminal domain-containing protein, partial [Tannerella sp.]|nr:type I restriction enzyme HsdR N-terminal domain-containing protein [Tannerella sp.]